MTVMLWMASIWLALSTAIVVLFVISRMSSRVDAWLCGARRSATVTQLRDVRAARETQQEMRLAA